MRAVAEASQRVDAGHGAQLWALQGLTLRHFSKKRKSIGLSEEGRSRAAHAHIDGGTARGDRETAEKLWDSALQPVGTPRMCLAYSEFRAGNRCQPKAHMDFPVHKSW